MNVGITADHQGLELKAAIARRLPDAGYSVKDFGPFESSSEDDYPDFIVPLAWAVTHSEADRGIAVCGTGVGACIAANKVRGARAAVVQDLYTARQCVEDDDVNILCLAGAVVGPELAWEIVRVFLRARFLPVPAHERRRNKLSRLESGLL